MNLKLSAVLAASLFAVSLAAPTPGVAGDGHLLGTTRLSHAENDRDVLHFGKCKRGIHAVQLRAERGQVEIEKLWVRYAKGGVDDLPVRDRIGEGSHSRWVDLRGGNRCIKAIGVIGDTELSFDQARIEIWGR